MQEDEIKIKIYSSIALILGILTFVQLLGLEKGIVAIVLGFLALNKASQKTNIKLKGFAWAGIILAIFYITFIVGFFIKNPNIIKNLQENADSISRMTR